MKIQNVKGGYDYLPKEQKIRNYINNILREVFEQYGFNSIETPILCYYDILSDKYDENNDILKEIYQLTDQGGRNLGLRYDLTVPFAKFIALNKNNISFPFKRYEINKVFRDGPVRLGRDREFTQCDCDVVGIKGQLVEAELLTLFVSAFQKLNIEIVIKYNSRNLMTGLILECGITEELVPNVTTIIDKKDKLTFDEFNQELNDIGINDSQIMNLNKYFSMNLEELNNIFAYTFNEYIKLGLEEIVNLKKYLEEINIDDICEFSITLARGQNYYTGNIFEVYEKNGRIKGSIGAGGRYDKIIGNFINDGNIYPTVGISFGLSSIYELLKSSDLFDNESNIDFYIIPMNTEIECLRLASKLRKLNFRVEIDMNNRKLKKNLEIANREKIPFVIILGDNELQENLFKVKNMSNGIQYKIKFNELDKISEILEI